MAHPTAPQLSCRCHAGVAAFSSAVRLAGGIGPYQGRVEVLSNGAWTPVCSDSFDHFAAAIVCRQLGYWRGSLSVDNGVYPWVGWTNRIYLSGTCQSDTPTLLGCALYPTSQCCGCNSAGVTCDNRTGGPAAGSRGLGVGACMAAVCVDPSLLLPLQ